MSSEQDNPHADRGAIWRGEYPFTSHWLALPDGMRLHYVDEAGGGNPVVMVHGNPTWSFYYRHLAAGLRGRHRCVVPDHIGCGLSDKPQHYSYRLATHVANLEELVIRHLGLQRFSLVLHDWGGAIGMGLAVKYPERVDKIMLLNTAAFPMPDCPLRIRLCRIPGFGALAIRGFNAFAGGAVRMAVVQEPLGREARAGYLAPYGNWRDRVATLRFVQDIPMSPSHPSWQPLREIEQGLRRLREKPVLIAWGGRDFCFTEPFLLRWASFLPQARIHRFPEAGHYVLEDARDQILPLAADFLAP